MGTILNYAYEVEAENIRNRNNIWFLFSHLKYSDDIRLEATFSGKTKNFKPGYTYILYPRMTSMCAIKIHNMHGKEVKYRSLNAFLFDWSNLKPYNNCPLATELINKINHVPNSGN